MDRPLPAYRGDLPYVFVCYAHTDAESVYPEIRRLQDAGLRLWYDEGISAGRVWRGEIGNAILGASQFLYYVSRHSLQSDHCSREVHLALDEAKEVVPVYLEDVALTSDLKVGLARLQALFRWRDSDYEQRLLHALTHGSSDVRRRTEPEPDPAPHEKSIAVMPFVNRSSDADQEYFSDGIADELLNLLTKVAGLKVVSRTSAFSFKGRSIDVREIARRLNVAHILEGSVRRAGNRVRIAAQLIDARSDTYLWSDSYDRSLDDIFAIQDDIAATVVKQLKIVLLAEPPKVAHTLSEAYALYLQARHVAMQGTADAFERSNALYEQALAIDPRYVPAWVGLSVNYGMQAGSHFRPFAEGYRLARAAAQRALEIAPDHAPALARLGMTAMVFDRDLAAAARYFEQALAREPENLEILERAALLLRGLGRLDDAIAVQEYRTARDPVDPLGHINLGGSYLYEGRWADAIASCRTARRLSAGHNLGGGIVHQALLQVGDAHAALVEVQRETAPGARRLAGLAMVHHALGESDKSDAAIAEVIADHGHDYAYEIASVFAFRNDADRAFEWLANARQFGSYDLMVEIPADNLFSHVRTDARWLPFLASIGKAPEQLAAIAFDVTLPS